MRRFFRRLFFLAFFPVLSLVPVGCASPTLTPEMLEHRVFLLYSVDGELYQGDNVPSLAFNEGLHVSGVVCNQFMGLGELEDDVLTVPKMVSTKKMCFNQDLNRIESLFSSMLIQGAGMELKHRELTLRAGAHTLVYRQKDWMR